MKQHKDFTYREFWRKGEQLWAVYVGVNILKTICRTEAEAKATADMLNYDPYFFEKQDWKQFLDQRA